MCVMMKKKKKGKGRKRKKKTDCIYYSNAVKGMAWDTICIDS